MPKNPPRRIKARRIIAASALAVGATASVVSAQTNVTTANAASLENGEAGEGGVVVDPGADLGHYLAQVDILEARTSLLGQFAAEGSKENALRLLSLMRQHFAANLEEAVGHHAEDFTEAFAELDEALNNGTDPLSAIDWLVMEFEEAREGLEPAPHASFAEIAALVRATTDILAADSGALAKAQAKALLATALNHNAPFLAGTDDKQKQVASEILVQIDQLTTGLSAAELDLSLFYGAAARVEISAGKVR